MASQVTFKIDKTEFDRAMRAYREVSKRTPAEICNKKAYYIARRALWYTDKADSKKIAAELGSLRKGKMRLTTRTRYTWSGKTYQAPFAALILNARARPGQGLYGAKMTEAIQKFLAARMRSVAFLKSGWIGAIKALENFVGSKAGLPPIDRQAKDKKIHGTGTPAADG